MWQDYGFERTNIIPLYTLKKTVEAIILAIKERYEFCGLFSSTYLYSFLNGNDSIRFNHAPSRYTSNNYRYLIDVFLPRFTQAFNHDNYLDYFGRSNGADEFTRYTAISEVLTDAVARLNDEGFTTTVIPQNTSNTDYAVKLESIFSKDFFLQRKTCMDMLRHVLRQFGYYSRNVLIESYKGATEYLPWNDAIAQMQLVAELDQDFDAILLVEKSSNDDKYIIHYAPNAMYVRKSYIDDMINNNPTLTNPQVHQWNNPNDTLYTFDKYLSFDLTNVYSKTYTAYDETITDYFYKLVTPWSAMQLLDLAHDAITSGQELRYRIVNDLGYVLQIIDGADYFQFLDV